MTRWLLLVLVMASGCKASPPAYGTPVAVRQGAFVVDVVTTGTVQPLDSHNIVLPAGVWGGNLERLRPEGQSVKKGDFIAQIGQRRIVERLINKRDELADLQREFARKKAAAPVKRLEIDEEVLAKERALKGEDLTWHTAARGGAADQVAAAQRDLTLARLAIAGSTAAQRRELFVRGAIAKAELDRAVLDEALAGLNRRRALLALAQLEPGAAIEEMAKGRRKAGMAKAAYDGARIEAPAKRALIGLESDKNKVEIRGVKKELRKLQRTVDATTLFAPAEGTLLYPLIWNWRKAHVGMQVWQGLTFLQVARLDAVKVEGSVGEREIGKVRTGLPVELTADGYPGRVFMATITHVSKLAKEEESRRGQSEGDASVKRFAIEVRPTGKTPELLPNMRVTMRIVAERRPDVTSIPADALFGESTTRWLWLAAAHGAGAPTKHPVVPTLFGRDWVALETPLQAGSKVYLLDPTQPPPEANGKGNGASPAPGGTP